MSVSNEMLKTIENIKPLSHSAVRLMKIIGDPDHTFYDVIRVVENDAVLTANILRVVNSAAMGLRTKITTINRAVPYVGDKVVIGMSLGLCAGQVYDDPLDGYEGERGILWRHSIRTAIAAREISRLSNNEVSPDIAYTAGIVHDIGKSIISQHMKGKTQELVAGANADEKKDYLMAEQELLGTDHCEVGGLLAEHWNLPEILQAGIKFHHHPHTAPESERLLVYAVHLGDFIAMMGGTGTGSDTLLYHLDERYKDFFALNITDIEKIFYVTGQEYEKTISAMEAGSGQEEKTS